MIPALITKMSKRKADTISNGVFLIGLGLLFYTNFWWPGILLVLWVTLFIRQYLTGRIYDAVITTVIFFGLFILSFFQFDWSILLPVLFILAGIHLIFREYCVAEGYEDEDMVEESEKEIEEAEPKKEDGNREAP